MKKREFEVFETVATSMGGGRWGNFAAFTNLDFDLLGRRDAAHGKLGAPAAQRGGMGDWLFGILGGGVWVFWSFGSFWDLDLSLGLGYKELGYWPGGEVGLGVASCLGSIN